MWTALLGGLIIGASASLAWSGAGQIAGISGFVGRAVRQPRDASFALWFLAGLLVTGAILGRIPGPWSLPTGLLRPLGVLIVAGVLVGYGTQLGNGCTSGHGVCGLSRASLRSFVAVVTFMLTAGLVVYVVRHVMAGGAS
jgi:uncharacterized membrane protein YedE/YeeE